MRDYQLYANIKPQKVREKTIKVVFVRQVISLRRFSLPRSGVHLNIGLHYLSLWGGGGGGLVPTKMAAKFRLLTKLLIFVIYIYFLASTDVQLPGESTDPSTGLRISASLIDISLYRANLLKSYAQSDRPSLLRLLYTFSRSLG